MRKEEGDRCEREERSVDKGITACGLRERARKALEGKKIMLDYIQRMEHRVEIYI